jgi:RNA polymerase sigma-70 factor (ECF subfamily)
VSLPAFRQVSAQPCVTPPIDEARWFRENVQPHESALRDYLRGRFPSLTDVDDIVQESYVRLFRSRQSGQVAEVRPYLFAIARNAACDFFRRNRNNSYNTVEEIERLAVVEDKANAAEIVSHDQELELLHEAIRALPERCQQVFVLRKLHALSHREIAEKLGIAENTVEGHISTGIFRCRQYLAARGVPASTKLNRARAER